MKLSLYVNEEILLTMLKAGKLYHNNSYIKNEYKWRNETRIYSHFNIYKKDIYDLHNDIKIIFKKDLLVAQDFYICLSHYEKKCYNDRYKFNFSSLEELSKFKKRILPKILNLAKKNYRETVDIQLPKIKSKATYKYGFSFAHIILLPFDIDLSKWIDKIKISKENKFYNKIIDEIKIQFPKVKIISY